MSDDVKRLRAMAEQMRDGGFGDVPLAGPDVLLALLDERDRLQQALAKYEADDVRYLAQLDALRRELRDARDDVAEVGEASRHKPHRAAAYRERLARIDALLGDGHDGPGGVIRWPHDSEGTPT